MGPFLPVLTPTMEKDTGEIRTWLLVFIEQYFVFQWVKCLREPESFRPFSPLQDTSLPTPARQEATPVHSWSEGTRQGTPEA